MLIMSHQTLQTSYTVKDIAPRLLIAKLLKNAHFSSEISVTCPFGRFDEKSFVSSGGHTAQDGLAGRARRHHSLDCRRERERRVASARATPRSSRPRLGFPCPWPQASATLCP
jgi:hypothetical protein